MWSQFYLIDNGKRLSSNYYFFQNVFGTKSYNHFRKYHQDILFDNRKLPLLKAKIQDITLTCKLSEIQETNVLSGIITLGLSPKQKAAYYGVITDIVKARIGDYEVISNSFVRLRQISSGWLPDNDLPDGDELPRTNPRTKATKRGYIEFLDSPKMLWFEDLIMNIDPSLKIVIFHEFIHTGERLSGICTSNNISHTRLWSGDNKSWKTEFVRGTSRVLIANVVSGGVGIDLSVADYLCFFESPASVTIRKQAEARPMGRKSRPIIIDDLVSSPVEKHILELYKEGKVIEEFLRRTPAEIADLLRIV